MDCESYSEWEDRVNPKIPHFYIDLNGVLKVAMERKSSDTLRLDKLHFNPNITQEDPLKMTAEIEVIRLKLFVFRDSDEKEVRLYARNKVEAEEIIYDRLHYKKET